MVNKESTRVTARVDEIMQVERYSSLHKLLRATAKVLCFIRKVKSKTSGTTREKMASNDVDDLKAAEVLWIQATQRNSFPEELKLLFELGTDGVTNPKSKIKQFGLYIDDEGVMRSRGRINASSLPPIARTSFIFRFYCYIYSSKAVYICVIIRCCILGVLSILMWQIRTEYLQIVYEYHEIYIRSKYSTRLHNERLE